MRWTPTTWTTWSERLRHLTDLAAARNDESNAVPATSTADTALDEVIRKKKDGTDNTRRIALMAGAVAIKTDPQLWRRAKEQACKQAGLCAHSARKMQWATRYYKKHGGSYKGKRSRRNSMAQWTVQRWRTQDGSPSEGKRRYLPDEAWRRLSPDEARRTNASKRRGFRKGKQWVAQPRDVARKTARVRTSFSPKK